MAIRIDPSNWYRLEGKILPLSEYGKYTEDISSLAGHDIWYTNVEVRLQNADSVNYVHGVNYKLRTFEQYGHTSIEEIAANFSADLTQMLSDMNANQGAITYTEAFAVTKSAVICYDDAYSKTLNKYIVVLRDTWLGDSLSGITAEYEGGAVAMGEEFDEDKLIVTGIFIDGHESRIMPGNYTVKRVSDNTETKVVDRTGTVKFTVSVTYMDETFEAGFTVQGVKKLTGVQGTYDGPDMALGKSVERHHFIITAIYSDGSASTVNEWSFYNGDKVTAANNGLLEIYYKGFTCTVHVNHYKTTVTQIKAFYTGPDVEKGRDFLEENLTVKIYSESDGGAHGFWEVLEPGTYTLSTKHISLEGDNVITVTYTTAHGLELSTNFIINGFDPKTEIGYIEAVYEGPPIMVGSYYNTNLVRVKAYWTDGSVTEEKDFSVNSTKVTAIGANEFTLMHKRMSCVFTVTGITGESTTESGYRETEVDFDYPEASYLRHRYRGPMESLKFTEESMDIYSNITRLYSLYNSLKKDYNNLNRGVQTLFGTASFVLNSCNEINDRIKSVKCTRKKNR